jgi:hypothetical protein
METIDQNENPCQNQNKKRRGRKPKHTVENVRETLKNITNEETPIELDTFHYHFSEEMGDRFMYFATLHRFDDRKTFKENWEKWIAETDVAECISKEMEMLKANGYVGDIIGKMFRSVRYYYRKKPMKEPTSTTKRKRYEMASKEILEEMDRHILLQITENRIDKRSSMSPAKAFAHYVETHEDVVEDKHKKIYKNRFYLLAKNIREPTVQGTSRAEPLSKARLVPSRCVPEPLP